MKNKTITTIITIILLTMTVTMNAQSWKEPWKVMSLPLIHLDTISVMHAKDSISFTQPSISFRLNKARVNNKPNVDIDLSGMYMNPLIGVGDREVDTPYGSTPSITHTITPKATKINLGTVETPKWADKQFGGSQF